MISSVIQRGDLIYPDPHYFYSPGESFPEYPFSHISDKPNAVYKAVRDCFKQVNLDKENYDSLKWNPLGDFIFPGNKIFILCNFVNHKRISQNQEDYFATITHPSIVRAICDYCIIALKGNGEIMIGNSPVQSANFDKILKSLDLDKVEKFYQTQGTGVNVKFVDLRNYITKYSKGGNLKVIKNEPEKDSIEIDFSNFSLFNEVKGNNKFRITNYDYRVVNYLHKKNKHLYNIDKKILGADIIISIPKLKVHEKVGVTLGIKGFVGTVPSKISLCHHRFGPPLLGGDEYPNHDFWKVPYSLIHDFAYSVKIPFLTTITQILEKNLSRLLNRFGSRINSGAWSGNDTAWRMAADLVRIIHFADKNGLISKDLKRTNLIFIDGIIGGEGQGPLKPNPVRTNAVIFSDNIIMGDLLSVILMGLDPSDFHIVNHFLKENAHKYLLDLNITPNQIYYNSKTFDISELKKKINYTYKLPRGWN